MSSLLVAKTISNRCRDFFDKELNLAIFMKNLRDLSKISNKIVSILLQCQAIWQISKYGSVKFGCGRAHEQLSKILLPTSAWDREKVQECVSFCDEAVDDSDQFFVQTQLLRAFVSVAFTQMDNTHTKALS